MGLLRRYWSLGVCPVLSVAAAIYGGLSYAGVTPDAVNKAMPSWAWFVIGYILLWIGSLLIANKQWQEIKKIKADPHTRWRELSKQAKEIISQVDHTVNQSVEISTLPLEEFQNCIKMLMEQVMQTDWEQMGEGVDFANGEQAKGWVKGVVKTGMNQVEQKSNPFLMVSGALPVAMNRHGIGIDSVSSTNYKTAQSDLRQIVKERAGSSSSKAYKDYLAIHNTHYSMILLSRYLTQFYQYAEALSPELRERLQEVEPILEVMNVMAAASAQESLARLDIAEASLIESIAGWPKETDEPT